MVRGKLACVPACDAVRRESDESIGGFVERGGLGIAIAVWLLLCVATGLISLAESAVDYARGNRSQSKRAAIVAGISFLLAGLTWFALQALD